MRYIMINFKSRNEKARGIHSPNLKWAAVVYLLSMTLVFVGCNNNRGGDGGGNAGAPPPQVVNPALVGACQGNFIPALTNVRGTAQSNAGELVLTQICGEAPRLMQNLGAMAVPGGANIIPFSIYSGPVMVFGSLSLAGQICGLPPGQYQVMSGMPGQVPVNGMNTGLGMASLGTISGLTVQIVGPTGALAGQLSGLTWSQSGGSIHISNPGVRINGSLQLQNGCSLSLF